MSVRGDRSSWTTPLAHSLGWKYPKRLRDILAKNGMKKPFRDLERALKILDDEGLSTAKFRAMMAKKNGTNGAATGATAAAPEGTETKRGAQPPEKAAVRMERFKSAWANKLPRRLARVLPEGDTPAGKKRVKMLLIAGGYAGPKWSDEGRAVKIFLANGINMDSFEYQNKALAPLPPEDLLQRYETLQMEHRALVAIMKDVKFLLGQYEDVMLNDRPSTITTLQHPLTVPFEALNAIRNPARSKRKDTANN